MSASGVSRGRDLAEGGRRIGIGPQWLARIVSGGFGKVLDRIDAGLATGAIQLTLPDGTRRTLGGRAAGFAAEVTLNDYRALLRLATGGSVGWYQAWEQGEWTSPDPVPLFALFMANATTLGNTARAQGPWRWLARRFHRLHRNTRAGAARNIHAHYDLGNDFYAAWLDSTMIYSSALFTSGDAKESTRPRRASQFFSDLSNGQSSKVAAIVNRLELEGGERILEIGCGWGTAASYLAETFDASVVAISLSDQQLDFARERWDNVEAGELEFRRQDYRDLTGQFDAVISIEMVEAVGREYWPDFFDCLARCLTPGGRAVLQYISIRDDLFDAYSASADFIQTYIFPGGLLIRESEFRRLAAARGLAWTDQTNFGLDYAQTLKLWRKNFDLAAAKGRLPAGFDERFINLWRFYLMYCEGGFRSRGIDVSQVTLIKG
jgi:cyclopropane-fatty-acyl-phospholipid synthase